MTFPEILAHEWRTRLSRPATLATLVLFAVMLAFAAVAGRVQRNAVERAIAAQRAEVAEATASWLRDLRALTNQGEASGVAPWHGSAMDLTFAAWLPSAPLADFAVGQSDLLPQTGVLSLWNPDARLFAKYEFDDPVALALGGFDLNRAVILLLPLVLIVLGFDVLSAERDSQRLGLLLAQGASLRRLLWLRLSICAGVATGLALLVMLAAALVPVGHAPVSARLAPFVAWSSGVLLQATFWTALVGAVVARNRRSEVNVIVLLLAWAGLTLLVPAAATAVVEAAWPTPSRAAFVTQARAAEIRTEREEPAAMGSFVADHPELVIDRASQIPGYVRTAFLVTRAVDAATQPVLAAFDEAARQRENTLAALRYLSPAIVVHGWLNDVAGTSDARHRRYVAAARAFKAAYAERVGPHVVAGRRLPLSEAESLPQWQFSDEAAAMPLRRHLGALAFLVLIAGSLLTWTDRRFRALRSP